MPGGLEPKWQRLPFVCAAVQRKGLPFTYRIGSFYSLEAGPAMSRLNPLNKPRGDFVNVLPFPLTHLTDEYAIR